VNSASLQSPHIPLGGIAVLPFLTLAKRASMPVVRRGSQAAASPFFGAPATPVAWQMAQVLPKTSSPLRSAWAEKATIERTATEINFFIKNTFFLNL
jgi:hypothetical protein